MALTPDATSTGTKQTNDTNQLTVAHTCSGSNRYLIVGISASRGDRVSGVTYNGVSMTQLVKAADTAGNNNYLYFYGLVAPATGSNNIVVSVSSSSELELCAASYTDVKQTGQPDATASANNASTTSISSSITVVNNGSWVVTYAGLQRAVTASTNVTSRVANPGTGWSTRLGDSNGGVSPGSYSQSFTFSSVTAGAMTQLQVALIPNIISKECTETLSLTDTRINTTARTLAEAITNTDTLIKQPQKVLSEAATLSDVLTTLRTKAILATETLTLTDTKITVATLIRTLTETVNLADTISIFKVSVKDLVESLTLSDTKTFIGAFIRTLTETLNLTETWRVKARWTHNPKPTSIWSDRSKPSTIWTPRNKP